MIGTTSSGMSDQLRDIRLLIIPLVSSNFFFSTGTRTFIELLEVSI
jgi:hypothetical protein